MEITEFKERFVSCSRTMFWAAYRLTGSDDDAEDIVQETFLRLWTHRDNLGAIANAEAYAVRMVRNVWLDRRRVPRPGMVAAGRETARIASDDDVGRTVEQRDLAAMANDIISRLPESQRQIIIMKDIEDRPYEEIAATTGLTTTHLRTLLCRARKTLRTVIAALDSGQRT
ncbi:MAG: RNA polymerase sigma factor [Prevotella sp.]